MKSRYQTPQVFIYLDVDGIESLHAQTVDRLETEFTRSAEKGKGGRIGARIGIGQALRVLLGLAEINAETELSLSGKRIEQVKSHLTTEHKLAALLRYLNTLKGDRFFDDLASAAQRCSKTGEPVFINVEEKFNLPQFYPGQDGVAAANQLKAVLFEIGAPPDDYDYSDRYFKAMKLRIVMSASLAKFPRLANGSMNYTGHDTILFTGHNGKNVPLNVFGYLISVKEIFYQIKPYAIWL